MNRVLLKNPEQMIQFKVYTRDGMEQVDRDTDRRLTRVRNQHRLPLGVWASQIVESIQSIASILFFMNLYVCMCKH